MTISSETTTLKEAFKLHRGEITKLLATTTPEKAALSLEKNGWPRKWACKAVTELETTRNPSNLPQGWAHNQGRREKLQSTATIGAFLFIVGSLVSLISLASALHSGGWIIIAYGAVVSGAGMWMKSYPELKRYPDRKLPIYVPPRDLKNSNPDDY